MPISYLESHVHTADGYRLTLYRSPPRGPRRVDPEARPVLLLPGAGANRFTFGLRADRSLPAILNARGLDVWLAELRGARSSKTLSARRSERPDVTLCLRLDHDLPAILATIRSVTGAERVDLVGHSIGGLLAMLAAGGALAPYIGRVVTVSAPGTFRGFVGGDEPGRLVRSVARGVEALSGSFDRIVVSPWARTPGPIPHLRSFQRHVLPGALDASERRLYFDHCVEDLPSGDLGQIARWIRKGQLEDRYGRGLEHYLAAVRAPVLALASPRDKVIPEALVRAGFDRLGSDDKTLVLVCKDHGHSRDYAHADILLARSAVADVLEPMAAWLADALDVRSSRRSAASG
ncbi:MAG: alpha/beta fold hydrolase [Myxococcota bacterium]